MWRERETNVTASALIHSTQLVASSRHTPLCRYHHATKQTPGWRLTQSRPGIMIWTTPGGRSYATYPTGYLG